MIRHMSDRIEAKIIALDLDDTLLKTDLTISDYTVGIVRTAVDGTSTIKFNRNITMKMPVNYQVSADNDYSTDEKHRIS